MKDLSLRRDPSIPRDDNSSLQNDTVIDYVEPSVSERREGSLRGNEGVSEDYERSSEGSGRDPSLRRDDSSSG